jgi:polyhydroxyalkanoate synthesis repressor PhaR
LPHGVILLHLDNALRYDTRVSAKPAPAHVIKRYGNRKLYDPTARRYVTLQDLARLVARGRDVRVLDQRSGEDLTNLTLAQALLESVRQGASRIPHEVLTRLIRIAAGPAAGWGQWPAPEEAAGRARRETEQVVARLLGTGRLSLDDAVTLRRDLSDLVHRLVSEAQSGVESSLRELLSRGEAAAERSLGALRGRLESYIEAPARRARRRRPRRAARAASRRSRK